MPNRLIIPGQPLLCLEGIRMSTLDEITKEKQRVSEALARVDAQREKLTSQLSELEATERVLARYSKGTRAGRAASAKTTAMKGATPARSGGRQREPRDRRPTDQRAGKLGDETVTEPSRRGSNVSGA